MAMGEVNKRPRKSGQGGLIQMVGCSVEAGRCAPDRCTPRCIVMSKLLSVTGSSTLAVRFHLHVHVEQLKL